MANIKISDLTAAGAASGTQEFEVNDSLASKKVTGAQILSYVQGNTTPASIGAVSTADTIAVAKGGTGATTAPNARTNLGLVIGTDVLAPNGSGASLTNLNASNLGSGTVPTARLASGSATSSTFLRGDQTWATAGGAPAALGDIGTVMWAIVDTTSVIFPGSTVAGSSCYYPTAFSFNSGSSIYTEGTSANSLPRQEFRINNIGSGIGRANRVRSGNVGYSFSTNNMTALSGTWRVLLPVLARTSAYDSCNVVTEATTNATLIQRIS